MAFTKLCPRCGAARLTWSTDALGGVTSITWSCGNTTRKQDQPDLCRLREQQAEIEQLRKQCAETAEWLNEAHGKNLDDWPEIFWWIREAAEAKGE